MVSLRKSLVLAVFTAAMVAMISASALAQPRRKPQRAGPRGGSSMSSKLGLLARPQVRAELEIVEDQQKELEALGKEVRSQMREMYSGLRDLPEDQRRKELAKIREKARELQKEVDKKVDEILLPNQQERLEQLILRTRIGRAGPGRALASEQLTRALGVTEEQKKRLAEVSQRVQKEMQEKIKKMRDEARDEILSVLTPEQRKKFEELTGEKVQRTRSKEN